MYIDDNDRYSQLRLIGWWDQQRISTAKVLVVGAGALGNEVLKNLSLLGMGKVFLVDFDHIQESNLSRSVLFRAHHTGQSKALVAAEMAMELNSDCQIMPIVGDVITEIGLGLVRDVDLAICCVDNREARLWLNRMCWKANTPWIDGGIQEINGVAKVFSPPDGACYECAMTENDYRLISLRYSCPLLKLEDIQMGKVPTAPTIASIIGGLQVQEALKLLHNLPAASGTALVFNGVANQFYQTRYVRRDECLSHETYDPITSLPVSSDSSVRELFVAAAATLGVVASTLRLLLDRDYLIRLACRSCGTAKEMDQPLRQVSAREGTCDSCQQPLAAETVCEIDAESPLFGRSLRSIGVPDYDIVKLTDAQGAYFVLLDNDAQKFEENVDAVE